MSKQALPKEYTPFVELAEDGQGKAGVLLPHAEITETDLIKSAGLSPDTYRVTPGTLRYRRWMRYDQEWLHYYAFAIERRAEDTPEQRAVEVRELLSLFRRRRGVSKPKPGLANDSFLVVESDWQIGKGEGGGTPDTVERIRASFERKERYLKELRRAGHRLPVGVMACTGDLHEGCLGFYAMQPFQVDLDRRSQTRVVRRLLREGIEMLAPHFDHFVVAGVGGNHGENRNSDGKAFTTFADNDDLVALDVLQEVFASKADYEHVSFVIPDEELSIVLDINGVKVGLAHGHQFGKGGGTAQKKAENWWAYQAFGYQPVADAQILVTGHYHHHSVVEYGLRTHIQAPSMDGGSKWFKDQTGLESAPGSLALVLDREIPRGWDRLRVL